ASRQRCVAKMPKVTQQDRPFARELLDRELRAIRAAAMAMGAAVEDAIRGAVNALVANDAALAGQVVDADPRINEMQREVSALVTTAIATQQPVARDLRFLLALDHVGYELERIGDHAKSVAKHAITLAAEPSLLPSTGLPEMGELAGRQMHEILLALVAVDDVA